MAQEAFCDGFAQFVEDLETAQAAFDGSGTGDDMAALLEACQALLESEEE